MEHHFRAFSFVDRILSITPGKEIAGSYLIPDLAAGSSGRGPAFCGSQGVFPSSLVAESVGQLAAWLAMAALDFQSRPVAGIASRVELLSKVEPGQTLELTATMESIEEDAVAYCGAAAVGGVPVIRLHHCVGPMVPIRDFDDPQAVRDRFGLICEKGATPGGFVGLPPITLERGPGEMGQWKSGKLNVPGEADFFADHFPRRPVFPGSLLMHANLELVGQLAAELPPASRAQSAECRVQSGDEVEDWGSAECRVQSAELGDKVGEKVGIADTSASGGWRLLEIVDMKLRAFIPPGEPIQIEATLEEIKGSTARIAVESRNAKRLAGSAQVLLGWD